MWRRSQGSSCETPNQTLVCREGEGWVLRLRWSLYFLWHDLVFMQRAVWIVTWSRTLIELLWYGREMSLENIRQWLTSERLCVCLIVAVTHEMKMKESEKPALTRNQTQITNYQPSQSSICAELMVLNASVAHTWQGHSVHATRTSLGIDQKIQERTRLSWRLSTVQWRVSWAWAWFLATFDHSLPLFVPRNI